MEDNRGNILMYQTVDGKTAIEVMLSNDTVWLTIDKMAELFQRNKSEFELRKSIEAIDQVIKSLINN